MRAQVSSGWILTTLCVALLAACDAGDPLDPGEDLDPTEDLTCSIPTSEIFSGGPGRDGIPSLQDPTLVGAGDAGAQYLRDGDRVIGLDLGGVQVAVPLNVAWWHEVVNMTIDTFVVAVSHCPLTGSSLVFDRKPHGSVAFGVSGLLFRNNLIMFDRRTGESLWPQMARGARCGPRDGTDLTMVPSVETTWIGWRTLHPQTRVVSSQTGWGRDYRVYPYGTYDEPTNATLLFPIPGGVNTQRPPKERVLGIPGSGARAMAFPFGALRASGSRAVVRATFEGREFVVFWDEEVEGAMAFTPRLGDGTELTFRVEGDEIVDEQTGSAWRVDGRATEGPLASERLTPLSDAYVAYWFAWNAFHPETELGIDE